MADRLPSGPRIAWCTNVHNATTIDGLIEAINTVSTTLDTIDCGLDAAVGLWFGPGMCSGRTLEALRTSLDKAHLKCIGLNGFPAMAFHDAVVKEAVYRPAWDDPKRLMYTRRCAKALMELLEPKSSAGITTVPLGWPSHDVDLHACVRHIRMICSDFDQLQERFGFDFHLDIEPEPGCILDTAQSLADFVRTHDLLDLAASGRLRACLDTCHLAVMHESPSDALDALASSHIAIGRIQVSSAIEADMTHSDDVRKSIEAFVEPRWMHQTTCVHADGREDWPDLPDALAKGTIGLWRTHIHVPVYLESIGPLSTTQSTIVDMFRALHARDLHPPLEVETYAYTALPASLQLVDLPTSIVREMTWTRDAAVAEGWQ